MKFIILSFRKNILPFIFVVLAIALVIFSESNLIAAKSGLVLWANNVVPAIFPFLVITELLSNTNIVYYLGKIFHKIMRPIFNVSGEGAFPLILGLISGYPMGGKIVSDMRNKGICTKDEGERLLAFTNNSGPLFVISSIGISLLGDTRTGILLLVTHILASITVGIIFAKLYSKTEEKKETLSTNYTHFSKKASLRFRDLGMVMGNSIHNSVSTVLMIGGFIIVFSIIISILDKSGLLSLTSRMLSPFLEFLGFDSDFAKPLLGGIIELTNGVSMVSKVSIKSITQNVVLIAFLLGFGGISILLQVFSIISSTDLSINKYILGKFLQGIFAAIYTYFAFKLFPFLSLDVISTSAPLSDAIIYPITILGLNPFLCLMLLLGLIILFVFSRPNKSKSYKVLS